MPPFTIALTGGIGSGKSTVAHLFAERGIDIVDADKIAREIVQNQPNVLKSIREKFGDGILDSKQQLDRRALGNQIFADATKRRWLENLLHPLIRAEMAQQASLSRSAYCIKVIPLLNQRDDEKRILVIDASRATQIKRVLERDNLSLSQVNAILHAQIPRYERLLIADDVILNDSNPLHLEEQVQKLHILYLTLAEKSHSPS